MASDWRRLRSERLLDEAEGAVARYDWEVVSEAAQAGLAFDPDNSNALGLLNGGARALSGSATSPVGQPTTSTPATTATTTLDNRTSPSAELRTSFAYGRYQERNLQWVW